MKTILVVEDNVANRELIREILEARGYKVVEANDGEKALAQIGACKPDLVLADIQMPVLDGFGLIRRIRNDNALSALLVVALTAFAMEGDEQKVLLSGFDGYVAKPIDMNVLIRVIQRLLESSGSSVPEMLASKT